MTPSGPIPEDLETIAAFIDQRLAPAERAAFLDRLDREEALYEVFVETVRCREEESGEEEDEDDADVVVYPSRWRKWALPAAAGLLVTSMAGVGLLRPAQPYSGMLVAEGRLADDLGEDWYENLWSPNRGGGPTAAESLAMFRVGVRSLDLEVALATDRAHDAGILAARLASMLGALRDDARLSDRYFRLSRDLDAAASTAGFIETARSLESLLSEQMDASGTAYRQGRWAEAGRLAAESGNRALLGSRSFRREAKRLASAGWPAEADAAGAALERFRESRGTDSDLERLAEAFAALLARR